MYNLLSFLFGGCLASFAISSFFYWLCMLPQFKKLKEELKLEKSQKENLKKYMLYSV
jgi:hypothetical protein